jgi:hypothetical protein
MMHHRSGLRATLWNAWIDFWKKFILNDHVTQGLVERYG